MSHKSGFVSIVGRPNVGKSSLMNKLVGENLSIVTHKTQTTRHRILGILNGDDFQIVYSDTPGILEPRYDLHNAMMNFVKVSLEDADLILLVVESNEEHDERTLSRFASLSVPIVLIINKIDVMRTSVEEKIAYWKSKVNVSEAVGVSAKTGENVDAILPLVMKYLPEHPGYFPKDTLTDRYERFFASEIIREKIFFNYEQEVPYSCEVSIESFKDESQLIRISAVIFVERESQKGIVIGKSGSALKKVGTEARKDLEAFLGKKVFLETRVKVADNWRKEKGRLRQFGYLG